MIDWSDPTKLRRRNGTKILAVVHAPKSHECVPWAVLDESGCFTRNKHDGKWMSPFTEEPLDIVMQPEVVKFWVQMKRKLVDGCVPPWSTWQAWGILPDSQTDNPADDENGEYGLAGPFEWIVPEES